VYVVGKIEIKGNQETPSTNHGNTMESRTVKPRNGLTNTSRLLMPDDGITLELYLSVRTLGTHLINIFLGDCHGFWSQSQGTQQDTLNIVSNPLIICLLTYFILFSKLVTLARFLQSSVWLSPVNSKERVYKQKVYLNILWRKWLIFQNLSTRPFQSVCCPSIPHYPINLKFISRLKHTIVWNLLSNTGQSMDSDQCNRRGALEEGGLFGTSQNMLAKHRKHVLSSFFISNNFTDHSHTDF
jgi:hypothetical protein